MEQEGVTPGNFIKQKEAVCMTRSDSMSIGSVGSDIVSVGGSEEMDTEDSERDPKEGFLRNERTQLSSQERQQKQGRDTLSLPLDNQRDAALELESITGDVTSLKYGYFYTVASWRSTVELQPKTALVIIIFLHFGQV